MLRSLLITACFVIAYIMPALAIEYNEQQLKSLFTSPAERQAINTGRRSDETNSSEEIVTGPANIQINGIVSRSGGKSVVWVNGRNTMKNTMIDGAKVYSNSMTRNNKIPVMIDGERVYIKPGETWSNETASEKDSL